VSDWVPPHGSAKYAVIRGPSDYLVIAIHAINVSAEVVYASEIHPLGIEHQTVSEVLGSPQAPIGPVHGYRAPRRIPADRILLMMQTSEAAWRYKHLLEQEDRQGARDN